MDNQQIKDAGQAAAEQFESRDEKIAYGIEVIGQMRVFLTGLLTGPDLGFIAMRIDNDLQRSQNFLNGVTGTLNHTIAATAGTVHQEFKPVTEILGRKIDLRQPITPEKTEVTLDEKAEFLRKRNLFISELLELTDDQILDRIQIPGEETIVRAAAKKLGLEDFRDAPIDIDFIGAMRTAKTAQDQTNATQTDADLAAQRLKEFEENEEDARTFLQDEHTDTEDEDEDPGDATPDTTGNAAPPAGAPAVDQAKTAQDQTKVTPSQTTKKGGRK